MPTRVSLHEETYPREVSIKLPTTLNLETEAASKEFISILSRIQVNDMYETNPFSIDGHSARHPVSSNTIRNLKQWLSDHPDFFKQYQEATKCSKEVAYKDLILLLNAYACYYQNMESDLKANKYDKNFIAPFMSIIQEIVLNNPNKIKIYPGIDENEIKTHLQNMILSEQEQVISILRDMDITDESLDHKKSIEWLSQNKEQIISIYTKSQADNKRLNSTHTTMHHLKELIYQFSMQRVMDDKLSVAQVWEKVTDKYRPG